MSFYLHGRTNHQCGAHIKQLVYLSLPYICKIAKSFTLFIRHRSCHFGMEILSCHSLPGYHVRMMSGQLLEKSLSPRLLRLSQCTYPRYSKQDHLCLNKLYKSQAPQSYNPLKGFRSSDMRVFSGYDSYVVDDEESLRSVTGSGERVTKVLIPGLPDESNGDHGAPISSCVLEWKPKLNVHYDKSGSDNVNSPPVLFLPGFGVGSFHYEKQLKDLGREFRVWAIDFLGQGMSLPSEDPTQSKDGGISVGGNSLWGFGDETEPWANKLVYSIDLWRDQVQYFVEEVLL